MTDTYIDFLSTIDATENLISDLEKARTATKRKDKSLLNENSKKYTLDNIELESNGRFDVLIGTSNFQCIYKKGKVKELFVMLNGWHPKNDLNPVFSRWSYYNYIQGHLIAVNDPMLLQRPDRNVCWFWGNDEEDYRENLAKLIKKIASKLTIPIKNIVILGSSAAGTASIFTGSYLENSISVSINPQLFIESELASEKTKTRGDVTNALEKNSNYQLMIVNCKSKQDYDPFLKLCKISKIRPKYGISVFGKLITLVYEASGDGVNHPHKSFEDPLIFSQIYKIIQYIREGEIEENELRKKFIFMIEEWHERYELLNKFSKEKFEIMFESNQKKCTDEILDVALGLYLNNDTKEINQILEKNNATSDYLSESQCKKIVATLDKELVPGIVRNYSEFLMINEPAYHKSLTSLCLSYTKDLDPELIKKIALSNRDGRQCKKDIETAIKLYENLNELDEKYSGDLAWALIKSNEPNNIKKALKICKKREEQNDYNCIRILSIMYHDGIGVQKDLNKSIELMKVVQQNNNKKTSDLIQLLLERKSEGDLEYIKKIDPNFFLKNSIEAAGDKSDKNNPNVVTIDIIGSCASRNIFNIKNGLEYDIHTYIQRQNPFLMFQKNNLNLGEDDLQLFIKKLEKEYPNDAKDFTHNFNRRMLLNLANQTSTELLMKNKSDWIILDTHYSQFETLLVVTTSTGEKLYYQGDKFVRWIKLIVDDNPKYKKWSTEYCSSSINMNYYLDQLTQFISKWGKNVIIINSIPADYITNPIGEKISNKSETWKKDCSRKMCDILKERLNCYVIELPNNIYSIDRCSVHYGYFICEYLKRTIDAIVLNKTYDFLKSEYQGCIEKVNENIMIDKKSAIMKYRELLHSNPPDYKNCLKICLGLIKQNDCSGYVKLSNHYLNGWGIEKSRNKAICLLGKACELDSQYESELLKLKSENMEIIEINLNDVIEEIKETIEK